MATLTEEANALMDRANELISVSMNEEITEMAKYLLSQSVKENVYPLYSPTQYNRRMDEGGLSDVRTYEATADDSTGDLHEIQIADNRYEVGVVESGEGYTWKRSMIYQMQPYPRPYFSPADEKVQESAGAFEEMILFRLAAL